MFQLQTNHFGQSNMSNGYKVHTVPYSELRHHLWDSLAPSVHTLLYTTVGPQQFCALPSECLALLRCQHPNLFVHQTSPVMDMLSTQVTTCQHLPATVESHAPYLPVFMALHILHTPSPTGSGSSLVQHASHTKSKHSSYFKVCHGPSRPSIFNPYPANVEKMVSS